MADSIKPLIGIPMFPGGVANDRVFWQFMHIAAYGWGLVQEPCSHIDIVRNRMATALMNRPDYTHLVMLDADHAHAPDIVQQLIRWPLKDRDRYQIVGSLQYRRGEPYEPMVFLREERTGHYVAPLDPPPCITRVAAIGLAAVCIDRRVFERLPPPWFVCDYPLGWDRLKGGLCRTEDTYFSQSCEKNDIPIWCDTTITSPHAIWQYVDKAFMERYIREHPRTVAADLPTPPAT